MSKIIVIDANSGDQWCTHNGVLYDTSTEQLRFGNGNTNTDASYNTSVWIPFTVNLPQGKKITKAELIITCRTTHSGAPTCPFACEDADNPSVPSTASDLDNRVATSAYTSYGLSVVSGTTYRYDITAAVQEVLDRAGWLAGNTLAVFIKTISGTDDIAEFASSRNTSYDTPQLEIEHHGFSPKVFMF